MIVPKALVKEAPIPKMKAIIKLFMPIEDLDDDWTPLPPPPPFEPVSTQPTQPQPSTPTIPSNLYQIEHTQLEYPYLDNYLVIILRPFILDDEGNFILDDKGIPIRQKHIITKLLKNLDNLQPKLTKNDFILLSGLEGFVPKLPTVIFIPLHLCHQPFAQEKKQMG